MLAYLRENLGWYLVRNLISADQAKDFSSAFNASVKAFVPHLNDCV